MVEQLTFNQLVPGSNPGVPTILVNFVLAMMRLFLLICVSLLFSCSNKNVQKQKYTFIFDFDETIAQDAVLPEVIKVSAGYDKIKIEKIFKLIKERKVDGKPIIHAILVEIEGILGHKATEKDFDIVTARLKITSNLEHVVKKIQDAGHQILIIGGAYSTCGSVVKVASRLGIDAKSIFSGSNSFDKNGDLIFDSNKNGYSNCKTNDRITSDWIKSDAIKELKRRGKISGKIIHIGDGENDLEVWKSGEVDLFIGFGVNTINKKVKKEAPVFVNSIEELEREIAKVTS